MRYHLNLPRFEDGTESNYIQLANLERARLREIAALYFNAGPSISNMWNAANAYIKSLPIIGISAADVNPYIQTGTAPTLGIKPAGAIKYLGSEKNWLDYANQLIKKNGLQTVQAGGKTYVRTPNGGMRSILNYGRDEYLVYQQNLLQELKQLADNMTGSYTPYETYTPTRLSHTSGSINKVRGKLSNRNANNANNFE